MFDPQPLGTPPSVRPVPEPPVRRPAAPRNAQTFNLVRQLRGEWSSMLSTTNLLRATGLDTQTVLAVVAGQEQLSSQDQAMLKWLTQGTGPRNRPSRVDGDESRAGEHERQLRNLNWKVKAIRARLTGVVAQSPAPPPTKTGAQRRPIEPELRSPAAVLFSETRTLGLVAAGVSRPRTEFPDWLHVKLSQGASQAYITSLPGARSVVRVVDTASTATAQALSRVDYRRYEILRDGSPDAPAFRPPPALLFQTGLSQGLITTPRVLQPKTFSEAKDGRSRPLEPAERRPTAPVRSLLFAPVEASRSLAGSLSGTAGRHAPSGQDGLAAGWSGGGDRSVTLQNGRTATAHIPIYQPVLDELADGRPERQGGGRRGRQQQQQGEEAAEAAQTTAKRSHEAAQLALRLQHQPQGKQLGELASRHLGQTMGSLLKKAYNLDSVNELDLEEAVNCLGLILKLGGDFTFSHSARVLDFALELADEMGIEDEQTRQEVRLGALFKDVGEMGVLLDSAPESKQDAIAGWLSSHDMRRAGLLHDIGKIKVPPDILYKPGKLTDDEYRIMKMHPVYGEEMVYPIQSLRHLCPVIRGHHERWDGKGYPDGLTGEETPIAARIIAVADVYDALAAERPYKAGMPVAKVQAILREGKGTHFDPDLIDAFERVLQRRFPELANPFD